MHRRLSFVTCLLQILRHLSHNLSSFKAARVQLVNQSPLQSETLWVYTADAPLKSQRSSFKKEITKVCTMKYSDFGQQFKSGSGIVGLMDDLGTALNDNPELIFMGGGNPGRIPAAEAFFQQELQTAAQDPEWLHGCFGVYQSPQGDRQFREAIAQVLQTNQGWPITADNIAVANGSQSAFFLLFNMLAGPTNASNSQSKGHKHILLPLIPEYIGYTDTGISSNLFRAKQPKIHHIDGHRYKYQVDFDQLDITDQTAAICVSRPTNPTGNMITDQELERLDALAKDAGIPLIIDGAYGLPFPNLVFGEGLPFWNDNTILALSLSKLGLPGVRTGILIGNQHIIASFTHANTVASLACGNIGPYLTRRSMASGELLQLCNTQIKPFYEQKVQEAMESIDQHLAGLPYKIHQPEGAIFLWLWFQGLPITCDELYQRLKAKGVLIVPGHHFFPGLDNDWPHQHECIRLSYAQPKEKIEEGIQILAAELRQVYAQS